MLIKPSLQHQLPRVGISSLAVREKVNPPGMDRFERQDQVADPGREIQRLKARGQVMAVGGVSVLVTSMALATAQAIAAGSAGMSAAMAIPLGVTGTLGITLLAAGLHRSGMGSTQQAAARH